MRAKKGAYGCVNRRRIIEPVAWSGKKMKAWGIYISQCLSHNLPTTNETKLHTSTCVDLFRLVPDSRQERRVKNPDRAAHLVTVWSFPSTSQIYYVSMTLRKRPFQVLEHISIPRKRRGHSGSRKKVFMLPKGVDEILFTLREKPNKLIIKTI